MNDTIRFTFYKALVFQYLTDIHGNLIIIITIIVKIIIEKRLQYEKDLKYVIEIHIIAPFQIRPIKLTKRAQIPAGTLPERGLTVKQVQNLEDETEEVERVPTYRPKDETAEEKKARKGAIKDERKVSRLLRIIWF